MERYPFFQHIILGSIDRCADRLPIFQYLVPWARIGAAREDSQSPEIGKQLWTWMEEQVEHV